MATGLKGIPFVEISPSKHLLIRSVVGGFGGSIRNSQELVARLWIVHSSDQVDEVVVEPFIC